MRIFASCAGSVSHFAMNSLAEREFAGSAAFLEQPNNLKTAGICHWHGP